jgi:hypothetical protein
MDEHLVPTNLLKDSPDYIALKRFQNSLDLLCVRYPDGVPDHIAAKSLEITVGEYNSLYDAIVIKIRQTMESFDFKDPLW